MFSMAFRTRAVTAANVVADENSPRNAPRWRTRDPDVTQGRLSYETWSGDSPLAARVANKHVAFMKRISTPDGPDKREFNVEFAPYNPQRAGVGWLRAAYRVNR